ncbi:Epa4p [Rhodotorula toruloides ATCC 204091]|uniref:Uncharacterized protein n=1 Tax=Rhodotorula toruloides TaxID=5286 RepID=A0A2T0AIN2_RHOTO|nr:Epa4p [Rhodotorula toruloides ATCC 204091]PRQ77866.1 hypothetical protein AAT19DRAFT_8934 [Rhodotorula toruloides]
MSPISDTLLTMLANGFGTLAVVGIVVYQFLEINAKRERERLAAELRAHADAPQQQDRLPFASPVKISSKTPHDTQQ